MKFVVMVGVMSFFADFTYEGSRSITGPYLGLLGASAFTISAVSGAGEFIGYNVRLFSGRGADRSAGTGRSRSAATSCRCRWFPCSRWPGTGRRPRR
jgi:hypothetical protein